MTKKELADTIGLFTWNFGNKFHIETAFGNFEWSCPDYLGGDNTIRSAKPYSEWIKDENVPFGRDKGQHRIGDYCGEDFELKT